MCHQTDQVGQVFDSRHIHNFHNEHYHQLHFIGLDTHLVVLEMGYMAKCHLADHLILSHQDQYLP